MNWFGIIPTTWETRPLWTVMRPRKNKNSDGKEQNLLSLSYGRIIRKSIDTATGLLPESFNGYNIIEADDIVLRLTDLQNDMRSLRTGLVKEHGIITSAYLTLIPKEEYSSTYFHYVLHAYDILKGFYNMGEGIRQGLGYDELSRLILPVPSFSEQSRIATFLDERCGKIDEAIAKHKALIEKLDEYRKGIITEAVTGGTFYNEETKDLPKGWTLCRIKNLLSPSKEGIKIGPFGSSLTGKVLGDAEYKVYGQWNIVGKDFSAGKNYVNEDTFKALYSYVVVEGDVLISMMGTIGKCTIIPSGIQPGIMDSHVIKARLNSLILPRFFEYEYDKDNSHYVFKQMLVNRTGSIMDGLNSTVVKNLHFLLPPLAEQQKIVAYLDEKCAAIDSAKERHAQLIAKLEEYKKSLIYNAVTGKIEC